jgi:PilZ domain
MKPTPDDRTESVPRIAPRHQFEARIAIHMKGGTVTEGWVRDVSESGLGAFVAHQLSVGEMVRLVIPLTESIKLQVPARVVGCVGTQYGFQFMALSAEQRMQINRAIQHRPTIPFTGNVR